MSFSDLLVHRLLIAHPDPATTADPTGQLITTATGQPIGDNAENTPAEWQDATEVRGRVSERTGTWPDGPGANAELVDARIYLEAGVAIAELDKVRRVDTEQAYQVVFVNAVSGGFGGVGGHIECQARRIPL